MILIVDICKDPLHYFEFVKPIEDILKNNKIKFKTIHHYNLTVRDTEKADKIIITGTSLKDNFFLEEIYGKGWIIMERKPILGICGGHQLISVVFGAQIKSKKEIGYYKEDFKKDFLGLKGDQEVYHLHNNYTTLPENFESYTESDIPQAIKHKTKPIYGTLFHPEVRNKELIKNFISS